MKKKTYIGIADCHGIESMMPEKDADVEFLPLRSMSNPQRFSVVYKITVNQKQYNMLEKHLKKQNFIGALRCIKTMQRGDDSSLGKLQDLHVDNPQFWKRIPNPKLDPYN